MNSPIGFRKLIALFAILALVFLQSSSMYAEDDSVDALDEGDAIDATQVVEEVNITLGQSIAEQVVAAEAKTATQESQKFIPTGDEALSLIDEKALNSLYLPLIVGPEESTTVNSAAADATNAPWYVILQDGFEGVWPHSRWQTFDNNGSTGGYYCWDDTNYFSFSGYWSIWPAKGCANGVNPAYYYYPNNLDSWATYGPFNLAGARQAQLKFRYWNNSERRYDWFYWCASGNGVYFSCKRTSGYNNWKNATLNLNDLRGDSTVWIAFVFTSDSSVVYDGPFVDNVLIQAKY